MQQLPTMNVITMYCKNRLIKNKKTKRQGKRTQATEAQLRQVEVDTKAAVPTSDVGTSLLNDFLRWTPLVWLGLVHQVHRRGLSPQESWGRGPALRGAGWAGGWQLDTQHPQCPLWDSSRGKSPVT